MTAMQLRPARARRRALVNVTSLIDVLFLLLIFFMLSSTFRTAGEMELDLPKSRTAGASPQASSERIAHLALRADGSVLFDGESVSKDALPERLAAFRTSHPEASVRLDAETQAQHGQVIEVLDMIREAGFAGVGLGAERQLPGGS
jgi:biopolymer transport protein ExbD